MDLSKVGRALLQGRGDAPETIETEGQMLQRACGELMALKNVVVINDEAHHCYREKVDADDEENLKGEEKDEAQKNNEAARLWINGIEALKPSRILECPPELGPVARQEWDRIVGELTQLGVLSSFDRGPLAAYCTAYALWIDAMEMVQKHGAMIKSPNGFPIQSPYLSHLNRQAEIMTRIASEFGFTPASRSRIFSFTQKNSMLLDAVDEPDDGRPW